MDLYLVHSLGPYIYICNSNICIFLIKKIILQIFAIMNSTGKKSAIWFPEYDGRGRGSTAPFETFPKIHPFWYGYTSLFYLERYLVASFQERHFVASFQERYLNIQIYKKYFFASYPRVQVNIYWNVQLLQQDLFSHFGRIQGGFLVVPGQWVWDYNLSFLFSLPCPPPPTNPPTNGWFSYLQPLGPISEFDLISMGIKRSESG